MLPPSRAPRSGRIVALIGCDGSGKSTLVADAEVALAGRVRVARVYLGLGTGELGERIKRLPLVGRWIEARLARKAKQTRTAGERIPGLGTALVVYAFSLLRHRRFRRMLRLQRQGMLVLTDRYPQVEVPGFYDGPGLSAARAGSGAVAALASRERRMYERMASHRPDLVIRLLIDPEVAHARKPEHPLEALRRKAAVTPQLRFGGATTADVDANQPYSAVRERVLALIEGVISA